MAQGPEHAHGTSGLAPSFASVRRRLIAGGAWVLAGRAANVGLGLVVSALLARLLTPPDMGAYFLAFSVVTIAATMGRMGLEYVVVKVVAEHLARMQPSMVRRALLPIYLLAASSGIIVAGLLALLVGPLLATGIFGSPRLAATAPLLGLWALALTFQILLAETFRGLHDIRWATVLGPTATTVLSAVAFGIWWLAVGEADLRIVVLVSAAAAGLVAAGASLLLRRRLPQLIGGPDRTIGIPTIFREAWPLLVTNTLAIAATQADLWIVGSFRPESDVAVYGAAARLVLLVSMSLTIANQVLPPIIGELSVQGQLARLQRVMRGIATITGAPALILLLVFLLLGGPVLGLVFGPHYAAGASVLAILSVGRSVGVYVGSCESTLIMTGHQRTLAVVATGTAVVLVGGALLVVEQFGLVGVAVVNSAAIAAQQLTLLALTRVRVGVWTHASPAVAIRALRDLSAHVTRARTADDN